MFNRSLSPTAPLRVQLVAALCACALLLAACGGGSNQGSSSSAGAPSTNTVSGPAADSGATTSPRGPLDDGMEALYAAALAAGEDTVVLAVSSTSAPVYSLMTQAMTNRFSGITVQLKETDFIQMGSIVQSELDAGQRTADVVTNAFLALKPLIDAGSIDDTTDWLELGVPEARLSDVGFLFINDGLCTTLVYNPNLIDAEDLPESLEGFLEPRWKDMISTLPSNGVACMGFYALRYGLDETVELVSGLKDNGMIFTNDSEQLMLAGERPLILFHYSLTAPRLEAQGAPVSEKLYPGTGVFRNRLGVITDSPVPNLARLLALWIVSEEATAILEEYYDGAQGFAFDPNSRVAQRTAALGHDLSDETFFVFENIDNFGQRAVAATRFRELFVN